MIDGNNVQGLIDVKTSQELCEMLDNMKKLIQDNSEPDGKCRFNAKSIGWSIQTMEAVLKDSIESYKME